MQEHIEKKVINVIGVIFKENPNLFEEVKSQLSSKKDEIKSMEYKIQSLGKDLDGYDFQELKDLFLEINEKMRLLDDKDKELLSNSIFKNYSLELNRKQKIFISFMLEKTNLYPLSIIVRYIS